LDAGLLSDCGTVFNGGIKHVPGSTGINMVQGGDKFMSEHYYRKPEIPEEDKPKTSLGFKGRSVVWNSLFNIVMAALMCLIGFVSAQTYVLVNKNNETLIVVRTRQEAVMKNVTSILSEITQFASKADLEKVSERLSKLERDFSSHVAAQEAAEKAKNAFDIQRQINSKVDK
jgi:hypothetical protein